MGKEASVGERPSELLGECLEAVGLRGIIDAYDRVVEVQGASTPMVRFGGHLPEEEDLEEELANAVRLASRTEARLFTHCLETLERRPDPCAWSCAHARLAPTRLRTTTRKMTSEQR